MQDFQELEQTKEKKQKVFLIPQTLGMFIPFISLTAFNAGIIRNELTLILVGTVFLFVSSYCFISMFLVFLINRKKNHLDRVQILNKELRAGEVCRCIYKKDRKHTFFRLPAILIRYEMSFYTFDRRYINYIFDPDLKDSSLSFTVQERGAYYPDDKLIIFDALGFFRLSFNILQEKTPSILASPRILEKPISLKLHPNGNIQKKEKLFLQKDIFANQRPYIPGDDPRRINWKLYSHIGELFIREGEPESPLHTKLLIIVDSEIDFSIYDFEEGICAVDLLCENALALTVEFTKRNIDVRIAYTGSNIHNGTQSDLAKVLAYPYTLPLNSKNEIPLNLKEDEGILILALQRRITEESALNRFLEKRKQANVIFFLLKTG